MTAADATSPKTISRVEIVRAGLEHCRFLYELYAKPPIMRALGLKLPIQATDWRRMIQGVWEGWQDVWILKEGPLPVGHIGLQDRSNLDKRAQILMAIEPSRQRRGIGISALRQVIDRCDHQLGIDLLIAHVHADNEKALSFFGSAGFSESGRIPRYYREVGGPVAQVTLVRHGDPQGCPVVRDTLPSQDLVRPIGKKRKGRR